MSESELTFHAGAFAELLGVIAECVVEGDLDDGLLRGSRNNRDGWKPSHVIVKRLRDGSCQ
jgi:hypothetical protein